MNLTPEQREACLAGLKEYEPVNDLTRGEVLVALAALRYAYEDAARIAESYADCPHAWIPLKHKLAEAMRSRIPKESA